jgi:hypothetical protein
MVFHGERRRRGGEREGEVPYAGHGAVPSRLINPEQNTNILLTPVADVATSL